MPITTGLKKVKRFIGHIVNKVPQIWGASEFEFQLHCIFATDNYEEHLLVIEEVKKMRETIEAKLGKENFKTMKTKRTKRI